jgi:transposase-like protein
MKQKRNTRRFTHSAIMRYMKLLELNAMNISATAKEIGVSRQTIHKWKSEYWNTYLLKKDEIKDQMRNIQAVKFSTVKEFDNLKEISTAALKLCLNKVIDILSDEDAIKKIKPHELAELIKAIAPYAAEKIGLSGTGLPAQTPGQQHTTFVQNIIEQMNIKKLKALQDAEKQNKV